MNQVLYIVCVLANFHPNSLDFIRQLLDKLVVLINGDDWSSVNWQRILISALFEAYDN